MLTERDLENPDPLRLDREIARAAEAFRAHRRRLARGAGFDGDPFVTTRLVTGQRALTAVRGMPDSDPLKASLVRWVYRLAEQRIDGTAIARVEMERRSIEHVVSEPEHDRLTLSAMLERALTTPKRREAWLAAFVEKSDVLGASVATLWERRQEVATRLAPPGTDAMRALEAIEGVGANVTEAAARFLDRTRDAFTGTVPPGLAGLVSAGLAEAGPAAWPRHLLPRTILDLFRDTDLFRSIELSPGELPEGVAPASFLRALARVGSAWIDAMAPTDQPFVIAHDPYGLRRRTLGALLGALPASPAFARRALGVDASRLADHRRHLGTALLVASRLAAFRVVLRGPALAGRRAFREAFEGEAHRSLGLALPATSAGAIFRLHVDDAQRFAGLLLAASQAESLRDANDEDWYRNPRTVEQLRDEARLPPPSTTTDDALAAGASALEATITAGL